MSTPLPPPAVPVFPAGYAPVTADFTNLIQIPMQFATNRIVFRANQQTTQSITTGAYRIITYDTVLEDPYSGWNSGSHQWLAPYTGLYEVTVFCSIATNPASLQVGIGITGTTIVGSQPETPSAQLGGAIAYGLYACTGGQDYIQGIAQVDNTSSTDVSAIGRYPRMEIVYAGRGN